MPSFPLLFHSSLAETIAWRDGSPVSVRAFLADVTHLAKALPAGGHVFNMCKDRYRFAVGLCATLVAGKISLLPSAHTAEAVRQLKAFAPDTFCLHDDANCTVDLPRFLFGSECVGTEASFADQCDSGDDSSDNPRLTVPQIDAQQIMACLFTSGSTGVPVPHAKKWGGLVQCLRGSAARLGLSGMGACTLVGTVPPQHMYGFENTVLLALTGGFAFSNGQPFYPGDVAAELAAVPEPRVLVTSPVHLRALMMSAQTLPPVALILSATAPLGEDLARTAEARLDAPLLEIYGSTESGQIATRRTAHSAAWALYPDIRMEMRRVPDPSDPVQATGAADTEDAPRGEATAWVSGGHIGAPVPMGDAIELLDSRHFLLHGRKGDLINIAGKRTSLGYLNHQLNAIPGVIDGVFFMPDEPASCSPSCTPSNHASARRSEHVTRLLAFAVAPDLTPARLQSALRERIDAAFMPRPLLFVASLPRNATGKLPRDVLMTLLEQHSSARSHAAATVTSATRLTAVAAASSTTMPTLQATTSRLTFTIEADHPALAGHFPGQPIVPGVVLLDHAISAIGAALNRSLDACRLNSAKFPSSAAPGTALELVFETTASGAIRFTVSAGTHTETHAGSNTGSRTVASGVLAAPASTEQAVRA